MAETSSPVEDSVCYLLELPAELRTNIWEFAAASDEDKIDIANRGLPAWTAACRQIRKEALPLWMVSNSVTICINVAGDVDKLIAFEQMCLEHVRTEKMGMKITFGDDPTLDLTGDSHPPLIGALGFWVGYAHKDGNWRPDQEAAVHPFSTMVITSLEIAMRCRSLPWDDVARIAAASVWGITHAMSQRR